MSKKNAGKSLGSSGVSLNYFLVRFKGFLQVHLGNGLENLAPLEQAYLGFLC